LREAVLLLKNEVKTRAPAFIQYKYVTLKWEVTEVGIEVK